MEKEREEQVISLCQKLIQQKSYSGEESGVVGVLSENMKQMGFDEVTVDKYGNPVKGYGDIESMRLCVSSNKGEPNEDIFGNDLKYDKTMSTHNLSCTIDEFTRLWIGIPKTQPYNYKVKAVAPSYSCIKYAIEKVNKNEDKSKTE